MNGSVSRSNRRGRTILRAALLAIAACLTFGNDLKAQARGGSQTARGTVERLTTAPKGEVDGAILDDGTFLHWPPHLEDRFTSVVDEGDRVEAVGFRETGKKGDERFEVQSLTNLQTDKTAQRDDGRPPDARREDRGAGRSRGDRIRQLKEEVERLEREIERLEREL